MPTLEIKGIGDELDARLAECLTRGETHGKAVFKAVVRTLTTAQEVQSVGLGTSKVRELNAESRFKWYAVGQCWHWACQNWPELFGDNGSASEEPGRLLDGKLSFRHSLPEILERERNRLRQSRSTTEGDDDDTVSTFTTATHTRRHTADDISAYSARRTTWCSDDDHTPFVRSRDQTRSPRLSCDPSHLQLPAAWDSSSTRADWPAMRLEDTLDQSPAPPSPLDTPTTTLDTPVTASHRTASPQLLPPLSRQRHSQSSAGRLTSHSPSPPLPPTYLLSSTVKAARTATPQPPPRPPAPTLSTAFNSRSNSASHSRDPTPPHAPAADTPAPTQPPRPAASLFHSLGARTDPLEETSRQLPAAERPQPGGAGGLPTSTGSSIGSQFHSASSGSSTGSLRVKPPPAQAPAATPEVYMLPARPNVRQLTQMHEQVCRTAGKLNIRVAEDDAAGHTPRTATVQRGMPKTPESVAAPQSAGHTPARVAAHKSSPANPALVTSEAAGAMLEPSLSPEQFAAGSQDVTALTPGAVTQCTSLMPPAASTVQHAEQLASPTTSKLSTAQCPEQLPASTGVFTDALRSPEMAVSSWASNGVVAAESECDVSVTPHTTQGVGTDSSPLPGHRTPGWSIFPAAQRAQHGAAHTQHDSPVSPDAHLNPYRHSAAGKTGLVGLLSNSSHTSPSPAATPAHLRTPAPLLNSPVSLEAAAATPAAGGVSCSQQAQHRQGLAGGSPHGGASSQWAVDALQGQQGQGAQSQQGVSVTSPVRDGDLHVSPDAWFPSSEEAPWVDEEHAMAVLQQLAADGRLGSLSLSPSPSPGPVTPAAGVQHTPQPSRRTAHTPGTRTPVARRSTAPPTVPDIGVMWDDLGSRPADGVRALRSASTPGVADRRSSQQGHDGPHKQGGGGAVQDERATPAASGGGGGTAGKKSKVSKVRQQVARLWALLSPASKQSVRKSVAEKAAGGGVSQVGRVQPGEVVAAGARQQGGAQVASTPGTASKLPRSRLSSASGGTPPAQPAGASKGGPNQPVSPVPQSNSTSTPAASRSTSQTPRHVVRSGADADHVGRQAAGDGMSSAVEDPKATEGGDEEVETSVSHAASADDMLAEGVADVVEFVDSVVETVAGKIENGFESLGRSWSDGNCRMQ